MLKIHLCTRLGNSFGNRINDDTSSVVGLTHWNAQRNKSKAEAATNVLKSRASAGTRIGNCQEPATTTPFWWTF